MTPLGPHLTVFLREYLPNQREMSVQTSDTYAYAFQLLVCFDAERLKTTPSALFIEQLDPTLVMAFLEHLEKERGNCARTRNSRLAAIKTFFRFLEYRLPTCLEQTRRIRAIPVKKTDEVIIGYLNREEIQALLDAPDPSCRHGLRDRAMFHLAYAGGLRVSELVGLRVADLTLHPQPTIHVMGKGRRERVLPLWKETAVAVRDWLKVRGEPNSTALFLNARDEAMTRSGFEYILEKHIRVASTKQPSLTQKRVSPHRLRHSCAMYTLHATGDIRKVSLWLGHATLQSTEVYLRADPTEKLEAMASLIPPPYGVVVSDRRISYSLCFDPNRSPVMRRPKPLNWRFRGSVCRPTPHINGRRIFSVLRCTAKKERPVLIANLKRNRVICESRAKDDSAYIFAERATPACRNQTGGACVSLENFKKQAKLLVRWHRERNYSVGGRIRQLSRYEDLTDTEALALSFPLNEAQEIIALEHGYNSWAELKQGLKKAPKAIRRDPASLKLTKAMPVLYVSDVQAAADFYRDKLGFTIDFLHGQPAFYASVSRDEAFIHLRFVHQPMYVAGLREKEQVIAAFLSVANVKELFAEYQTRKVPFVHRLKKEPWGQSSFIVSDPDGNALCFAG